MCTCISISMTMFVFGSVTMIWKLVIWKLVQVACMCILFQNESGVKDLLLKGIQVQTDNELYVFSNNISPWMNFK